MSNVTVNISFQDRLLRDIDRVARGEARSRSELLREAARAYIQRQERWTQLFALGREVAAKRDLKPQEVATEIAAFRKSRVSRR
ncbi:MAG: ribbon-helix-helix domain-containing protein [Lentisphaerae bacterium]|nr:ribbon-helix-helix domain-containing protein [Lentisphaerota bacterium]